MRSRCRFVVGHIAASKRAWVSRFSTNKNPIIGKELMNKAPNRQTPSGPVFRAARCVETHFLAVPGRDSNWCRVVQLFGFEPLISAIGRSLVPRWGLSLLQTKLMLAARTYCGKHREENRNRGGHRGIQQQTDQGARDAILPIEEGERG